MNIGGQIPAAALDMRTPYRPVALYLHEADSVEYVRQDIPAIYERVDEILTLVHSMENPSEIIGFRLKGFRNVYLQHLKHRFEKFGDFLALVSVLEELVELVGDKVIDAYAKARAIAAEDGVTLTDLPNAA